MDTNFVDKIEYYIENNKLLWNYNKAFSTLFNICKRNAEKNVSAKEK